MKHIKDIFLILALVACSHNDDTIIHNDISEYQGIWRDTIFFNDEILVEDFVVNNNAINYTLSNVETHIIYDKQNGNLIIGNENKIEWSCISPINNIARQTYWDVLDLSTYQMKLFSKIQGEHNFRRVYYPSVDEYIMKDTLSEMLMYKKYLPLTKTEIEERFGRYNRKANDMGLTYMVNHPLIEKINFIENCDKDSIFSYTITTINWKECKHIVDSQFVKFRSKNNLTEYIDRESLDNSKDVIIADSSTNQITFSPLRDYDYWPNVSHFLGKKIQEVKDEYEDKYVYIFSKSAADGLFEYLYQTKQDGVCENIAFAADTSGFIRRCWVTILGNYSESQKTMILHLLGSKYSTRKDSENDTFFFYPGSSIEESEYEVKYEANLKKISYINK